MHQNELQTGVFGTGPAAVDSGSRSRSGTCSISCCGSDSLLLLSSSGICSEVWFPDSVMELSVGKKAVIGDSDSKRLFLEMEAIVEHAAVMPVLTTHARL